MSEEKIVLTLEANDEASKKIEAIAKALRNMDKEASASGDGASNSVSSMVSNFEKGVTKINSATRQYNASMSGFNRTMKSIVKEMGSAIYDFTSDSIKNFSEFSEQHAKVLGAMAADYDKTAESQARFFADSQKLKQQAMQIGTYGVNGNGALTNITGVSQAQESLVKAGIDVNTIVNTNVLKDVLTFAQGNQLDIDSAVSTAVTLGNQFNIDPKDWGSMLDKISHTADMSIVEVSDIVTSLKWASGISSGLDRSLEETLAMITVLGDFGLKGSQAGTGIQALLTRILTGDTTVITDAQKEVAPGNALEKFYEFEKKAKPDGNLLPMSEVLDELNATMEDMTDEEQAWFAKKLFGLYQMKSAYALLNGEETDLNDVIEEIKTQSEGTNENKLEQLLQSQHGQLTSLNNLWEGVKTDFGDRLNPFIDAIRDELFNFLKSDGNYDINFDNLRSALDESCDLIEEKYGSAIANAVRGIGDLTIDLAQVVQEVGPEFGEGLLKIFGDAVNGGGLLGNDGVFKNWSTMIDNMYTSVDGLPEEMQGLGDAIVTVIDWCGKLVAINVASEIAELISSALQIMSIIGGAIIKVNGAVYVNGNGTGVGAGGNGTGGGSTPDVDVPVTGTGGGGTNGGVIKNPRGGVLKQGKSTIGSADDVAEMFGTSADDVIAKLGKKASYSVDDVAKGLGKSSDEILDALRTGSKGSNIWGKLLGNADEAADAVGDVAKGLGKSGGLWSKFTKFGKGLSIATTVLEAGLTGYEAYNEFKAGDNQAGAETIGKGAGSIGLGWAGAAAGSTFGPIGTIIGGILGSWLGGDAGETLVMMSDNSEEGRRRLYEKYGGSYKGNYKYYEQYDNTPDSTKRLREESKVKPSDYGMPEVLNKHFDPYTGEIDWESIISQLTHANSYPSTSQSIFDKYGGLSLENAQYFASSKEYQDYLSGVKSWEDEMAKLSAQLVTIVEGDANYDKNLDKAGVGYYTIWTGTQEQFEEYMKNHSKDNSWLSNPDPKYNQKGASASNPYMISELSNAIKNAIIEGMKQSKTENEGSKLPDDFEYVIPSTSGYNALSNQGRKQLIDDLFKDQTRLPSLGNVNVVSQAPTVNVDVDVAVDNNNRVTKNTTTTTSAGLPSASKFAIGGNAMNEWWARNSSQYGSTRK